MANMSFEDIARDHDRVKDAFLNECVYAHSNGYELFGHWEPDHKGKNGEEIRLKRKGEKSGQRGAAAHIYYDMPPHGFIYDFHEGATVAEWTISKSGLRFTAGDGSAPVIQITPQQKRMAAEVRAREIAQKQAETAENAERIFQTARAAALRDYEGMLEIAPCGATGPGAEYMKSKGVSSLPGIRVTWKREGIFPRGALVVPYYDIFSGEFITFQRIIPGGVKGFNKGGFGDHKAVYWIGTDSPSCAPFLRGKNVFAICEGYATGATFAALSGLPVGIAGDAGKVFKVAKAILSEIKNARIIIAADDDFMKTQQFFDEFKKATGKELSAVLKDMDPEGKEKKPGTNTGKDKAMEAYNLDRSRVYPAPPPWNWFNEDSSAGRDLEAAIRSPKAARSDWNDYAAYYPDEAGKEARAAVENARAHFQSRQ